MSNHDLDWLAAQRPSRAGADREAHDRALLALLRHATARPAARHRGLSLPRPRGSRMLTLATGSGMAAIAAAVVLSAGGQAGTPATSGSAASAHGASPTLPVVVSHHRAKSPLIRLADDISTSTAPGNATLVQRTTHTGGQNITVYDLYTDSGPYYFSRNESGMPAQVSGNHDQGDGLFAREVAAAEEAASGNVQQGALDLANAPAPNGRYRITSATETTPTPAELAAAKAKAKLVGQPVSPGTDFDNWAWEDAQDAIIAGAGNPQVRAGVLKILALLPGVTVSQGTGPDGQPTLVLTAGAYEVGANYQEQLTVNAENGMPVQFVGGAPGQAPETTVDYQVRRVTLSDVAAGQLPSF